MSNTFTNSGLTAIRGINTAKINGSMKNAAAPYTPADRNITKITIHHAGGVTGCAALLAFLNSAQCGASCNYCIGNDGVIGQQVEEKNRAWTSSSPANDYQAVTIEVGNSTGAPNWQVGDKAMAALIDLCADICRRNPGIKQKDGKAGLYYDGTPDASLTLHEMFAATLCPGPFLKGKIRYICDEVNKRLGAADVPAASAPSQTATTYTAVKGDTMSGIAQRFGLMLSALAAANPQIRDLNKIDAGQKISIPGNSTAVASAPAATLNGISEGDLVLITQPYASASTDFAATNRIAMNTKRYVTKIHKGRSYPFQFGVKKGCTSSGNTTGFARKSGIRKVEF